ncbi:MAG: hypothetical protein ACI4V1_02470 [Eubacteriales bacterium]
MKNKALALTLAFVLAFLLPVGVLAVLETTTPDQYSESFLAGLGRKYELLKTTGSPKIVLIGGSSAAFGIDTDLLEENLPYEVVNFGLYATLGTKLMLDLSRDYIEEGDLVIIAPELDEQTFSLYFNAQSVWQAAESNPSLLTGVAWENIGAMLGGYWGYLSGKMSAAEKNAPAPTGVYSLSSIDENGDISYPREGNTMLLGYDPNMIITLDDRLLDADFLDYLNDYAAMCEKRGASCYFSFAPTNRAALAEGTTDEQILAFYDRLDRALDFEILSNVNDCLYDAGYFYDTNFHLNDAGVIAHSATLLRDIRRVLGNPAPVTIEIPDPPSLSVRTELETTDVEREDMSALFTYEDYASGLMITGVTEEGKEKEILYLPASYEEKTVVAIGEGALAGCAATDIYLSETIVQLYDGIFTSCDHLTAIHLPMEDATRIAVGHGLLEGAPAETKLYMSLEAYASFYNDYSWTKYADRMALEE